MALAPNFTAQFEAAKTLQAGDEVAIERDEMVIRDNSMYGTGKKRITPWVVREPMKNGLLYVYHLGDPERGKWAANYLKFRARPGHPGQGWIELGGFGFPGPVQATVSVTRQTKKTLAGSVRGKKTMAEFPFGKIEIRKWGRGRYDWFVFAPENARKWQAHGSATRKLQAENDARTAAQKFLGVQFEWVYLDDAGKITESRKTAPERPGDGVSFLSFDDRAHFETAIVRAMHVQGAGGTVGAIDTNSMQIRLNGSKKHPKVELLVTALRKRRKGAVPLRFKVHNPHPPRPFKADGAAASCGPGTIPIKRKAYTRKGKGGRRIRVGAAQFCIVDQGSPGKASFGAKGPGALRPNTKALINRKGSLGEGFLKSMTDKQREAAIRKALKHSSYASVMGKLVVLALSAEIRKRYGAKLERAKAYLRTLHEKSKKPKKRASKKPAAKKKTAKKTAKRPGKKTAKKTAKRAPKKTAKKRASKKTAKRTLSAREQSQILDQYLAGKGC